MSIEKRTHGGAPPWQIYPLRKTRMCGRQLRAVRHHLEAEWLAYAGWAAFVITGVAERKLVTADYHSFSPINPPSSPAFMPSLVTLKKCGHGYTRSGHIDRYDHIVALCALPMSFARI